MEWIKKIPAYLLATFDVVPWLDILSRISINLNLCGVKYVTLCWNNNTQGILTLMTKAVNINETKSYRRQSFVLFIKLEEL